jgi:glutathione S-transferase
MHALILHSYRRCPFAIRVRMVLEEKNLKYTTIEEDLSAPSAELLRLHPEGKVPLLIHGELAIHESSIITEYLEESFGPPDLLPRTPVERATLRMWTFWCNEIFKPDLDSYKYNWEDLTDLDRTTLNDRIRNHIEKMETPLSQHSFILGDDLTLADIHLFPFYRQLQKSRPEFRTQFKTLHLDRWLEEITLRPSFERVMRKSSSKTHQK